jgi:hypothetical protein
MLPNLIQIHFMVSEMKHTDEQAKLKLKLNSLA